jgi:CBS domain-containing protein
MPIAMKVKDVMDKKVFSLDVSATTEEAVKMMIKNNVWSLVVERQGHPEGVVTERDIIRRCLGKGLSPSKTYVGVIESRPLITVGKDATIRDAMDLMSAKEIRRLFVMEDGKIVGRITQTDVFQSTVSLMETLSGLEGEP